MDHTLYNAAKGIWTCPFCGFNDKFPPTKKSLKLIRLVPSDVGKTPYIAEQECPECWEQSWFHVSEKSAKMFAYMVREGLEQLELPADLLKKALRMQL